MTTQPQQPKLNTCNGPLAWFPRNHVCANLLTMLVLVGGVVSMLRMRMVVFPELDSQRIAIRVPYLGASPGDVEEGVCIRIEEALAGLEGIRRLRSTAQENLGTVVAELEDFADTPTVLREIESAVARINTFPKETERPIISEVSNRVQVLSVVIYGEVSERTLKTLATGMYEDLTSLSNITQVEFSGTRPYEISIEVSEQTLRRYRLSFDEIAIAIRRSSLNLPGGSLKTPSGKILIRTEGQNYTGFEFQKIILRSSADGTVLRLGQVASVIDGFENLDLVTQFDGKPAVILNVFRVGDQDALKVAAAVKDYVKERRLSLPSSIAVDTWFDRSIYLEERISLLVRNAYIGLILVFCCLALFLDTRLAIWTTLGIPFSFLATFWILPQFDVTINMLSLFAFIVVLGVVVDDAIVVGENIMTQREKGLGPVDAAVQGVREMAAPVTFAALTTIAAFAPLLYTTGEVGRIARTIPIVVICVLVFSLLEAIFILPAHIAMTRFSTAAGRWSAVQARVRTALDRFVHIWYVPALRRATNWRYATAAASVVLLCLAFGFVGGGHIKFKFFSEIDADNVVAELTMPQGTPIEHTRRVVHKIEEAAARARQTLNATRKSETDIFTHINTIIGHQPFAEIAAGSEARGVEVRETGAHLAEINIELLGGDIRDVASTSIADLWRAEVGELAGITSLKFISTFLSVGNAIHLELAHRDPHQLTKAATQLKNRLAHYRGVIDIEDSFSPGFPEIRLTLKSNGRKLNLTLMDLARQVRQGFYGEEVQRIQRGREDIRVMLRYPQSGRRSQGDLESMRIRGTDGTEVPFRTVAEARIGPGYSMIQRADRRRVVAVTANVNGQLASADEINRDLAQEILPQLARQIPGLRYKFEGEQREQQKSLQSLAINASIALIVIFVLLGIEFGSYLQPLIVMSAVPFGVLGAILGHVVMGIDLSFLSAFGIVALIGIVVNDSLVMVDCVNRERRCGVPLHDAIVNSGVKRFRPILLTTLTTAAAVTPMLLERSLQALWLLPIASSLAFGVFFATAVTLFLVPVMYLILEDFKTILTGRQAPEPTSVEIATLVTQDSVH